MWCYLYIMSFMHSFLSHNNWMFSNPFVIVASWYMPIEIFRIPVVSKFYHFELIAWPFDFIIHGKILTGCWPQWLIVLLCLIFLRLLYCWIHFLSTHVKILLFLFNRVHFLLVEASIRGRLLSSSTEHFFIYTIAFTGFGYFLLWCSRLAVIQVLFWFSVSLYNT